MTTAELTAADGQRTRPGRVAPVVCRDRGRAARRRADRGSTLVEVAVATALLGACATIIGAGLSVVATLGERVVAAEAARRALEDEIVRWPAALLEVCAPGAASVMDAAPSEAWRSEPPALWSADGGWAALGTTDCAGLAAQGLSGEAVLRWRASTTAGDSVEIATRVRWP